MTTEEIWKPVVGYEGLYEVSNLGGMRSLGVTGVDKTGRTYSRPAIPRMTTGNNSAGYPEVNLKLNRSRKTHRVHVLLLSAFVGPRPEGYITRHLNGIRDDNRLENLAWGTQSENMYDKRQHGTDHNVNKTHCPKGHEYTQDNIYTHGGVRRSCKTCIDTAVKARQKELTGTEPPFHGTYYIYNIYGCRCEPCRDAKRVQRRKEKS